MHPKYIFYGDNDAASRRHHYAPAKILGFVEWPASPSIMVIVQSCKFTHTRNSIISTGWELEDTDDRYGTYVVDVDVIVRSSLMLPLDEAKGQYFEF